MTFLHDETCPFPALVVLLVGFLWGVCCCTKIHVVELMTMMLAFHQPPTTLVTRAWVPSSRCRRHAVVITVALQHHWVR